MTALGKLMIITGLAIAALGLLLTLGSKWPLLGRLPGDLRIERGNFTVFFPLASCLLLSLLLSLLLWLFRR